MTFLLEGRVILPWISVTLHVYVLTQHEILF